MTAPHTAGVRWLANLDAEAVVADTVTAIVDDPELAGVLDTLGEALAAATDRHATGLAAEATVAAIRLVATITHRRLLEQLTEVIALEVALGYHQPPPARRLRWWPRR